MSNPMRTHTQSSSANAKKRILFVDDEQNVRSALRRSFQREGYEIAFARNGEEAMQMLAEAPVHLVVSDNKMPRMSGVDLVKKVRVLHPQTRCMMLTGFEDPALSTPQVSRCVEQVIQKPWNDMALREAVSDCLNIDHVPEELVPSIWSDVPVVKPQKAKCSTLGFDFLCYALALCIGAWTVTANQVLIEPSDNSQLAGQLEKVLNRMDEMQSLAHSWASFDAG